MSISSLLNLDGVSSRKDGSILPNGMSSVRAPIMGQDQRMQLEGIQSLLGKGAEQSVQGLLNQGKTPIDDMAISRFQREIMPQMTQGAAHNNLLGASGIAGAQAEATSQLSQGLAAQKYSAIQDLLSKYGQFAQMSPYKYSAYQEPRLNIGDLLSSLGQTKGNKGGWGSKIGGVGGGLAGAYFPQVGPAAGYKIGSTLGSGVDWLVEKLFGDDAGGQLDAYENEIKQLLSGQQYY